jgi:hypothetical protein
MASLSGELKSIHPAPRARLFFSVEPVDFDSTNYFIVTVGSLVVSNRKERRPGKLAGDFPGS